MASITEKYIPPQKQIKNERGGGWAWWFIPVIPAPGKLWQEDSCELDSCLGYIVSSTPVSKHKRATKPE